MDNGIQPIDIRPHLGRVWGGYDGGCDGCEHLWYEQDMGKSLMHCSVNGPLGRCDRFAPNALYRMSEASDV